jgi:hypothetical protein
LFCIGIAHSFFDFVSSSFQHRLFAALRFHFIKHAAAILLRVNHFVRGALPLRFLQGWGVADFAASLILLHC